MFRIQLKKLREQNGYKSQKAFADAIGVSQSTVGNWESGTREPNLQLILKIANTLNVSVDELLGNIQANAPKLNLLSEPSGYWDGSRLCDERNQLKYSIPFVSSQLGMSQEDYMCLESGSADPSFELLLKLSDLFNFDLDHICHRMMKLDNKEPMFGHNESLVIQMYRSIPIDARNRIFNSLKYEYDQSIGEEASPAARQA